MRHSDNLAVKIADQLRSELLNNCGEKIFWSSRKLAGSFNCSHYTVNAALNILASEGLLQRKRGAGSWQQQTVARPRIACLMDDNRVSSFSMLQYLVKLLLLLLEKNQCDYQLFSFQDLKSANFSPHIFRNFDGLIIDTRFNDPNSRQLIYEFDRPKLWPWPTFYHLATGNQVVADYLSVFGLILKKAKLWGVKKCYMYHRKDDFYSIMRSAFDGSGWEKDQVEYIDLGNINTILAASKYAMNIPVGPEILHITSADMIAWGFFEAMLERGLEPGDFHITGLGNMEGFGFTPLGEPKLTTTHHPREPYLEMAVQMFCRQIREKSNVSEIIRIPGELILRESAFYKKK